MSYFKNGVLVERASTTATSGTTVTLVANSNVYQEFTGSTAQTVVLPSGTTLAIGMRYVIQNRSTALLTVNDGAGALLGYVIPGSERLFQIQSTASTAGSWDVEMGVIGIDTPMRLFASATANTKLNFSGNVIFAADGTQIITSPLSQNVPAVVASTADFVSGATTGATFVGFTLPTSTIGNYVRCGFSLTSAGAIQTIFSAQNAARASLANPGTLIPSSNFPIGYVDLQAVTTTTYKTAGSTSTVIENAPGGAAAISRFAGGGGGSSGGGGGSLQWIENINSPTPDIDLGNNRIYRFAQGAAQNLYTVVKVPHTFNGTTPVTLRLGFTSPDTAGTALLRTISTLIRQGVDVITSTTNQRTSTNTALTLSSGTQNRVQSISFDLSDASGNINGVAVAADNLVLVQLTRGTDTGTSDLSALVYAAEVTFQ